VHLWTYCGERDRNSRVHFSFARSYYLRVWDSTGINKVRGGSRIVCVCERGGGHFTQNVSLLLHNGCELTVAIVHSFFIRS